LRVFRIADRRHPLMDGVGAFLYGGRWNSPGRRVIYAARTYGGALLEQLAHAEIGFLPRSQVWIAIDIPDDLPIDRVVADEVPEWDADHKISSRVRGDRWLRERLAIALLVPSAVTAGVESNVLINPEHSGFGRITTSEPMPVQWDRRLLRT
jgi:RES domain-containing protein